MVFAWVAMASTGMVMARYLFFNLNNLIYRSNNKTHLIIFSMITIFRYYKQTWKSVRPFNKDLWFTLHQICMALVVTISIAAFIVTCVVKGFLPYTTKEIMNNPHPATGKAISFMYSKCLITLNNIHVCRLKPP